MPRGQLLESRLKARCDDINRGQSNSNAVSDLVDGPGVRASDAAYADELKAKTNKHGSILSLRLTARFA